MESVELGTINILLATWYLEILQLKHLISKIVRLVNIDRF